MALDTDFDRHADGRRRLIKFDPTISSGTILQMASMFLVAAGAWATYQSDKATTKLELDQVKSAAAADKLGTKEALSELKSDVREMARTLNQVTQTLAVIEARQAPKEKR